MSTPTTTLFLDVVDGRLAYDDTGGNGRAVICVPGIGDVRAEYRHLRPLLVDAGYRVVTVDLRGHGETAVTWPSYAPDAIGADVVALLDHLEVRGAILIGESMAAASVVWAAAESPDRVAGVVLAGPFVRDHPTPWWQRLAIPLLTAPVWARLLRLMYPTRPADLGDHLDALRDNLRQPGRMRALKAMLRTSKDACEARIPEVSVPVLVLVGTADRDFSDPAGEAAWLAGCFDSEVHLLEGVGHYPQAEVPARTAELVTDFVERRCPGPA